MSIGASGASSQQLLLSSALLRARCGAKYGPFAGVGGSIAAKIERGAEPALTADVAPVMVMKLFIAGSFSCPVSDSVSDSVSMSFLLAGGFGWLLILQPNHGGGGYYTVFPDLPIFLLCSGNKNHPGVPTVNCWIGADE